MNFLLRIFASVTIVSRRLVAQPGLALVTLIGLVISISMILSVPLYADAVYHRTFLGKLDQVGADTARQPFSFVFTYAGSWHGNKQWDDIQPLDAYLNTRIESALDMPLQSIERYVATRSGELYPSYVESSQYGNPNLVLESASFGQMTHLEEHIRLVEGAFPQLSGAEAASAADVIPTVEVLFSLELANDLGVQPGELYTLLLRGETETGAQTATQYTVRVAGVWEPLDAKESFWIFNPSMLKNVLLVPEQSFALQVSPYLPDEIQSAFWYVVMDGAKVRSNHVNGLLGRIQRFQNQAGLLLPNLETLFAPTSALRSYQRASTLLKILLYAFSVPVVGLILAFIGLVSTLSIERKQNEIAVTRSRGAAVPQVLGSIALESLLLGLVAFALSLPVALLATRLISTQASFQDLLLVFQKSGLQGAWGWLQQAFGVQPGLQVADLWNPATLRTGIIAVAINMVAMVLPAFNAAKFTIVTYKRERARSQRPPLWQRAWLDVLLFLVAAYGAYQLKQQGGVVTLLAASTGSTSGQSVLSDPMSNPLLFLVPSLIVFALSLFLLRLIPPVMSLVSWLLTYTRSVGVLLATRHLSRSTATYRTPLIILVFTLSLSAYTASLARTLNNHLYDQTYYQVGADMKFLELGYTPPVNPMGFGSQPVEDTSRQFVFVPVSEYLQVEGVQAVARLGRFATAYRPSSGGMVAGMFYGIDRLDFPKVAFWRDDFSRENLGVLMNLLAATPNGILVSQSFLNEYRIEVEDTINLAVSIYQVEVPVDVTIVGVFNLFPTWYPEDGPLFVGNLDYLFSSAGGEFPYHIWLKLNPQADPGVVAGEGLSAMDLKVVSWEASQPKIQTVQDQPERQGIFGLLSLGFTASAILTVLGFLLYALFSFQRRFIELGVMRAGGLSLAQMALYMAMELGFLIGMGGALGTALGIWTSRFFIPFLQIGVQAADRVPPYVILIDWPLIFQIYGFFAALFVVTFVVLVFLLMRMKIFQAVKLGEVI